MYVCISTFFLDMRDTLKSEIHILTKFSYSQITIPSSLDLSSGIAVLGTWKQNQRAFPLYIFKNKVFWHHKYCLLWLLQYVFNWEYCIQLNAYEKANKFYNSISWIFYFPLKKQFHFPPIAIVPFIFLSYHWQKEIKN